MTDHQDPLDAFLEDARPDDPPADLVERILAAAADPELRREAYWADVGETARRALVASAAGLLVSAGLAWLAVAPTGPDAPVANRVNTTDIDTTDTPAQAEEPDPAEQLAISSEPLEQQLAGGFFLLGEGER